MSNSIVLPLQTSYVLKLLDTKKCNKIAWLGAPQHYSPSLDVKQKFKQIEQHFFDIIADDTTFTHKWDINSTGWGRMLLAQKFDLITVFRLGMHAVNYDSVINELETFLVEGNVVLFEDIIGREKYANKPAIYTNSRGFVYHAHNSTDSYMERLRQKFKCESIESHKPLDPDITCTYVTLTSK